MPSVSRDNKVRPRPIVAPRRRRSVFQLDPVADGDVDTFILEISLLVGHVGDQFLVDTVPDIGQVDRVHG